MSRLRPPSPRKDNAARGINLALRLLRQGVQAKIGVTTGSAFAGVIGVYPVVASRPPDGRSSVLVMELFLDDEGYKKRVCANPIHTTPAHTEPMRGVVFLDLFQPSAATTKFFELSELK